MKNPRLQSNNHRHAYLCKSKPVEETRLALENALSHHDMLRTLAIHDDASTPLHIVLRPSSTWFQHCITTLDEPIDTAADLKRLLSNDPQYDFAAYPGPMFRAVVTHVREENCAGLVYMIQHSVFDGISLEFFLQDFDALLVAGKTTSSSSSSSSSTTTPLPRIDRIRIPIPQLSSSANFCAIAYQSPSRHSFPSRSVISSTKSPRSGLKEIRRVGLMNLLENLVRNENSPHRKKKKIKKKA